MEADEGPAIGLWGTFDLDNFGDVVLPRIARMELSRRIPGASFRVFSPFGPTAGARMVERDPEPEALGPWTPERAAELAEELAMIVIGGGELVHEHDELYGPYYGLLPEVSAAAMTGHWFIEGPGQSAEHRVPVVWNGLGMSGPASESLAIRLARSLRERALVSVRDERSRAWLLEAGVRREIELVPDSVLLLPRLFGEDLRTRRLAFLRRAGWFPDEGSPLVVQGHSALLPHVDGFAAAILRLLDSDPSRSAVIVEAGPIHGDDLVADELLSRLPEGRVHRMPPEVWPEDLAAAIAASGGVIGSSMHTAIAAFAFGRPFVLVDITGHPKIQGFVELIGEPGRRVEDPAAIGPAFDAAAARGEFPGTLEGLQARIDAHFDRVAALAGRSLQQPAGHVGRQAGPEVALWLRDALERREAVAARFQRVFADHVADHVTDLELEITRLGSLLEERDRELEGIKASRSWRWTAPTRRR